MKNKDRPYLGMHFNCCNAYRRIYLNREGTAFCGHCPKCAQPIRVKVSDSGSSDKFWTAE